jgi:hypothetical protein
MSEANPSPDMACGKDFSEFRAPMQMFFSGGAIQGFVQGWYSAGPGSGRIEDEDEDECVPTPGCV